MNDAVDNQHLLGFRYRIPEITAMTVPAGDAAEVCRGARARFGDYVHATVALENIKYTRDEVARLLAGITVGGHRLEEEQQVLNEARAWDRLITLVENGRFSLDEATFCNLHRLVSRDPGLTWGVFQERTVPVGGTYYRAPRSHILHERFEPGVQALQTLVDPVERAIAFFLFAGLHRFLLNFNERTARLMMQGILMAGGYSPIRVPVAMRMELDIRMMRFYDTLDGSDVMQFLLTCEAEAAQARHQKKGRRWR